MKLYKKIIITVVAVLGLALLVKAATLGSVDTFGILASTFTNTTSTTINGDIGYTTGPATTPTVSGVTHIADGAYTVAGTDQATLLGSLNAEPCDFTFGSATDLSLLTQPLTAGVYCITGATSIGTGGITLGSGTYIFRIDGALDTVANSIVTGSGCEVFWTPTAATTLGANSTFKGTLIDDSGITVGANTTWEGRALAFGGTITTDSDTISVPSCSTPTPVNTPTSEATNWTPYHGTPVPTPIPTAPLVCTPITDFSVENRTKGDHQLELSWHGGDARVEVWETDGVNVEPFDIANTGFYEAKNLDNGFNYWFWVENECSKTEKIDPLP